MTKKKEMTVRELARMGGSWKGPKGFATSPDNRRKAAKATERALSLIVADEGMAQAIVEAVRSKRVCNLRFKVMP